MPGLADPQPFRQYLAEIVLRNRSKRRPLNASTCRRSTDPTAAVTAQSRRDRGSHGPMAGPFLAWAGSSA
jgi:hypothetical protein